METINSINLTPYQLMSPPQNLWVLFVKIVLEDEPPEESA